MKLTLLGVVVDGVPDIGDPTKRKYWTIKLGPYEACVTEWNFEHQGSDSPPYRNYSYHLKVGSEYILHSQSSVESPADAVALIDRALSQYVKDKERVEFIYSYL